MVKNDAAAEKAARAQRRAAEAARLATRPPAEIAEGIDYSQETGLPPEE
jgi:hypothetical protein